MPKPVTPDVKHPRLSRVYARSGDKHDLWDEWADDYDTDLIDDLGYVAPRHAGDLLMELVPDRAARILDAGCGTGLAGQYLATHGYRDLHGVDYSEPMLAVARERNVYASLRQHDLTRPLSVDTAFDAIICVGVFAFFPPFVSDLRHLMSAVRAGQPVVVTVNGKGWVEKDWERLLAAEERAGAFRIERLVTTPYLQTPGIDGRILVLRD